MAFSVVWANMVNCGGAKGTKGSPATKNRAVPSGPARFKSHVTHAPPASATKGDQLGFIGQHEHAALRNDGRDIDRRAQLLR
jgi:hypothetical protein